MFRLPFSVTLLVAVSSVHASQLIDNLRDGKPQTVVAYGTSLTAQTAAGRWVTDLRNWLNADYPGLATVINSGQSGKASNTAVLNLQTAVLSHHPDTVFLEFSMNDAFTNFSASNNPTDWTPAITPARAKSNLESMISSIRTQNPFAEIILMTMNPVFNSASNPTAATYRPELVTYYDVYRAVAAEQGLLLIDHYANWKPIYDENFALFQAYVPDGVHPTAAGASTVIFPQIRESLTAVPEPETSGLLLMSGIFVFTALLFRLNRARVCAVRTTPPRK